MTRFMIITFSAFVMLAGNCLAQQEGTNKIKEEAAMKIEVKSTAFTEGGTIPKKFTCDDVDVSPALAWSRGPEGTKSWALICDDPDAPMGTWVHWVLYDLAPEKTSLTEGVPKEKAVLGGAHQGVNGSRKIGYMGPCPPPGKPHRYFFKVYALDFMPNWEAGKTKAEVVKAMEGHILAEGQLMGKYGR